jgi:Transposase, Mutator family
MARTHPRPAATLQRHLAPVCDHCWSCDRALWITDTNRRTVTTLAGLVACTLQIRSCPNRACERYRRPYRPEAEGGLVLPHAEFGLDVIAFVGTRRYRDHRSVPEIHRELGERGLSISERAVTELMHRYEELVTVRLADRERLRERLAQQPYVVLALDGLQPDVGHEVLWVVRDVLSGEVLRARALLSATGEDLAALLREVHAALPVPVRGVISDGQLSIRSAVKAALPGVPHQLCQFHYLREAAQPIYEADRHAKKELKKQVRGVRPIERALEGREDPEAQATRAYCLAVRSALTDDGRPPLGAAGLKLHDRLTAIHASIAGIAEKRGCLRS